MAVYYERRGNAAIITIDRPERRNAVDHATALELRDHFRAFVADDAARVLVVTGAGGEAFCAGADLKAMDSPIMAAEGPMGFTRLHSHKPTIAAIDGWCVAGGLEIACWCDLRIAGEGSTLGCLERRWGVPLMDGGTVRLPQIVGLGRALELILTGRTVDVAEAKAIGLVNAIAPRGGALDAALVMAEQIAAFPWDCVISDRASAYRSLDLPLAEALDAEMLFGRGAIGPAAAGAQRFASGEGRHGVRP